MTTVGYSVEGRSPTPFGKPLAELELTYSAWNRNVFDLDPQFVYLPPCPGPGYAEGQFYDWENIAFRGDLRVQPWSPAVDRGWLATYSSGYRQILSTDGKGRRRLLTPDLGARESHNH